MTMMNLDSGIKLTNSPGNEASQPILDASWLQASLNRLGATPPLVVDGIIGAATRTAIRAFQKTKPDLTTNGVANPKTIAAIQSAIAKL